MNHNFFPILSPVRLRIDMRVPAFPNAVRTPAPTFSTLHRSALFLIVWDAHLCTTCCFFLPFSFVHIAVTPLPEFQPQPILCPRVSSYSHLPFATAQGATHSHMSHEDIIPHTGHWRLWASLACFTWALWAMFQHYLQLSEVPPQGLVVGRPLPLQDGNSLPLRRSVPLWISSPGGPCCLSPSPYL